jgi:ATP-binding cassette, subfamily C (CFTR/MRP), member 1
MASARDQDPADPQAEAEAVVEPLEPGTPVSIIDEDEEERRKDEDEDERARRQEMNRTQSYATDTSAVTRTTTRPSVKDKYTPWYKSFNPLRWGHMPPVPQEREISHEYGAGFFSKLTFQWMAPLMQVSRTHRRYR